MSKQVISVIRSRFHKTLVELSALPRSQASNALGGLINAQVGLVEKREVEAHSDLVDRALRVLGVFRGAQVRCLG